MGANAPEPPESELPESLVDPESVSEPAVVSSAAVVESLELPLSPESVPASVQVTSESESRKKFVMRPVSRWPGWSLSNRTVCSAPSANSVTSISTRV